MHGIRDKNENLISLKIRSLFDVFYALGNEFTMFSLVLICSAFRLRFDK